MLDRLTHKNCAVSSVSVCKINAPPPGEPALRHKENTKYQRLHVTLVWHCTDMDRVAAYFISSTFHAVIIATWSSGRVGQASCRCARRAAACVTKISTLTRINSIRNKHHNRVVVAVHSGINNFVWTGIDAACGYLQA